MWDKEQYSSDRLFKLLAALCDRVYLRVINCRALEALIYGGAVDTIE